MTITPVTAPEDIATVARLAHLIWNEHYVPIIGQGQVDYMVDKLQSATAIQGQIRKGYEYFLMRLEDLAPVGYFAIQPELAQREMFLSKLYIRKDMRTKGWGAVALEFIESSCKARGLSRLWLTVNKGNPAVHFYRRLGFQTTTALVMDIGDGYVMDDYRMEKTL